MTKLTSAIFVFLSPDQRVSLFRAETLRADRYWIMVRNRDTRADFNGENEAAFDHQSMFPLVANVCGGKPDHPRTINLRRFASQILQ